MSIHPTQAKRYEELEKACMFPVSYCHITWVLYIFGPPTQHRHVEHLQYIATYIHRWASLFKKVAYKALNTNKFLQSASDTNVVL